MKKENIILIGFMGVGKGTIARALVKSSDYFAVDTDDLIESLENKKIKKIFKDDGESYFRALEKKCALWCEKNITGSIISTGGGFYKQSNLKKIGQVIYLQSTFESILQGLRNAPNSKQKFKKRPLLNDLKEAKKIYNQRVKEYENVADIVVNVEDWNEKKAVKNILKAISLQ
jgi:shikimate kinase